MRSKGAEVAVDEELFRKESGVGIVVTEEEVVTFVNRLFEENAEAIKENGASFDFPKLIYRARDELKWADQKKVVELINAKKKELVGDAPAGEKGKKDKKPAPPKDKAKDPEENK